MRHQSKQQGTRGFARRHLGPSATDVEAMLRQVKADSLTKLIDETLPPDIRTTETLVLPEPLTEISYLKHMEGVAGKNRRLLSCIGLGYFDTVTPPVILRNVLENPGWYTPYTPYQAEVAQGRLEALLNFQTMVTELTGMDVANASLLDEGTAAAEAMGLFYRVQNRRPRDRPRMVFLVSTGCYPQTIAVLRSRAEPLGICLHMAEPDALAYDDPDAFGVLLQTPDRDGAVHDLSGCIDKAHGNDLLVAVAADLLCCTLFIPPGEYGADVVLGNSQRFGVPLGCGGPHAAFFATSDDLTREMPGRIIGVSVDSEGGRAYRMALQTREQHIRREKAKSNICTAQALLANMAGFYAMYHGPEGLKNIAQRIHTFASAISAAGQAMGIPQLNETFFDTLCFDAGMSSHEIRIEAEKAGYNFRYDDNNRVGISIGESVTEMDAEMIVAVLARAWGKTPPLVDEDGVVAPAENLTRTSPFLTHEIFSCYHTETEMMRYLKRLERKDIGLDSSMIPLGSCTMKLNAAVQMTPITWPAFASIHPFAPRDQIEGYQGVCDFLEKALCAVTGLDAVSLQPNSGAQGEYAGLVVIRAFHRDRGDTDRTVVFIPSSAHGTNPASAVMAGFEVVILSCDEAGNIDLDDVRAKLDTHGARLGALMVTYPSTHGVFERNIRAVCSMIHEAGGQVYLDGANMNAQVGLTNPAMIGADVCHINLHKTFSIPHGGGGPGMGPIAVAKHLASYLPGHPLVTTGGELALPAVASAPWGSALILLISYGYLRLLGGGGATEASRTAILNANYIKTRLADHYDVLFAGAHGRVAHEVIFDLREFKSSGISETDIAKRLMDYGFHAPTVSWPVPGTMMIEPTECESKSELDRFCDALIAIRGEIQAVVNGDADPHDNVLMHAPHPMHIVAADVWTHPYSRTAAAYPLPYLREHKVWPTVCRIDNTMGDRNLMCTCPSPVEFQDGG